MAITSRLKSRIAGGIRPRALVISIVAAILIAVLLNTVPTIVATALCKDMTVRDTSERALSLAQRISHDGIEGIEDRLRYYTARGDVRVIVTDSSAQVIFDSSIYDNITQEYLLISGVRRALSGESFEKGAIEKEAFSAYAVAPILAPEAQGAVYIWRRNADAMHAVRTLQNSLVLITICLVLAVLFGVNFGASRMSKRLRYVMSGVRRVRDGAFGEQMQNAGEDEISKLTEEINELSTQVYETEELRHTFVSDASHELRTPLSSIRLLMDSIIQTENIDVETTKEFMQDIGEQIDRLTRIAERLLTLTRLDGAKKLQLEPVDLKKVAETVVATLEENARDAQVNLQCNFADGCVFLGVADGTYQIIFNLVENAIKYNRPGGVVRIYIFNKEEMCHVIVDDNGIGIPPEDFERIFERFYRVDKARSRSDKGGTGLGLSIVAKTVKNFNGAIKVEPSVDGGVRFTVTFPKYSEGVAL